jgi:hypothetical protein
VQGQHHVRAGADFTNFIWAVIFRLSCNQGRN